MKRGSITVLSRHHSFSFNGASEAAEIVCALSPEPFNDVFLLLVAGGEQRLLRIV